MPNTYFSFVKINILKGNFGDWERHNVFLFKQTFIKKTSCCVEPDSDPIADRAVFWKTMVAFHEVKLKMSKMYSEKL